MSHVANVMMSVEPDDRPRVEELSQWLRTAAPRRGFNGKAGWVGSLNETTGAGTLWGGGKFPECDVFAGALNHADLSALVARVERASWKYPEFVQLFVLDQEQAYFRVWMFYGPTLRQIVPGAREEEVEPSGAPAGIRTRFALADDARLLRDIVVAAVNWAPGRDVPRDVALADPRNARYVDGWPREGDLGVVAVAEQESSRWQPVPAGAAWLRFFSANDPGYGFIAAGIPELSIGVDRAQRGRGIGTLLIRRLCQAAADVGIEHVSLSVARENPAVRLCEREGFRVHDSRSAGDSLTMIADIRPGEDPPPCDYGSRYR